MALRQQAHSTQRRAGAGGPPPLGPSDLGPAGERRPALGSRASAPPVGEGRARAPGGRGAGARRGTRARTSLFFARGNARAVRSSRCALPLDVRVPVGKLWPVG